MKKKYVLLLFLVTLLLGVTGCSSREKRELEKKALSYFTEKYAINKKDIEVINNYLYGKDRRCLDSCGDNKLTLRYNDKEYTIEYNPFIDCFGDNYQYDVIYQEFLLYLENKFPYANNISIDTTLLNADIMDVPVKYSFDIEKYFEEMKEFDNNHPFIRDGVNYIPRSIFTWVDVWIKADTPDEATNLKKAYSDEVVQTLQKIGVSFNLAISKDVKDNEYSAYYYYHVYGKQFYFTDRVKGR